MPALLGQSGLRPSDRRSWDELISEAERFLLSVHNREPARLRCDSASTVLIDGVTGVLIGLAADARTPLRSAVAAAVGVKHLAPSGSRSLGILASGRSALAQAHALARVLPALEEIRLWSPEPASEPDLAARIERELRIATCATKHAAEAIADADVATAIEPPASDYAPLPVAWIRPGALLVSSALSVPPALLATSRRFIATLRAPQVLAMSVPAGEVRLRPRYDRARDLELAETILGRYPARLSDDDTVLYELATTACAPVQLGP